MYEKVKHVFSKQERILAAKEGLRRQRFNECRNIKGRNGGAEYGSDAENHHLIGAAGEMAVASILGLKEELYKEINPVKGSYDLPPNIDVKTRSKEYYDLIVQLDDNIDKRYVLVTIENKQCWIHGWIEGKDAMKDDYIYSPNERGEAYFIPKNVLIPMYEWY